MVMALTPLATKGDSLAMVLARMEAGSGVLSPVKNLSRIMESARRADPSDGLNSLVPLALGTSDSLLGIIAIHGLSAVGSAEVDEMLTHIVSMGGGRAEHAAWALSRRPPYPPALPALVGLAEAGGFGQMMSELAIENWMKRTPELAYRPWVDQGLRSLAEPLEQTDPPQRSKPGLRLAQVLMQGRVDPDLTTAASGDGGGLITLQVGLTAELSEHPSVADVFLITRSISGEGNRLEMPYESIGGKGTLARLRFGPEGYLPAAEMWSHRAELEREMRKFLNTHGPFDAIHARFADVGSFVAARLADELGIPLYFTLAPDPHALISAWEESERINRGNFGEFDQELHLLFRAWMVEWMLDHAEKLALLPRRGQREALIEYLDVDIASDPRRFVVIPEGVDFSKAAQARVVIDGLADEAELPPVLADLDAAIKELPSERQGLPVILSVGRLDPIKGMDRLVSAWVGDPIIRSRFNLLIVGGNLDSPTSEEDGVLASIHKAMDSQVPETSGLVWLGSRSHQDVALVMAATESGFGGVVGPKGVYVAASEKEEFGLAIVEAMAAGLPVVAPKVGGPGIYVDHGVTGYLADTTTVEGIRAGIAWADQWRASLVRATRASNLVQTGYSLSAMADDLVDLYTSDGLRPVAP